MHGIQTSQDMLVTVLLLVSAVAHAASLSSKSSHLKYMSFYGFDPDSQHSWSNLGAEGDTQLKIYAYAKYGMQSLYGPVPTGQDGIFIRGKGLSPHWQDALKKTCDEVRPLMANKTIVGVFFGDELCCGGIPLSNLTAVVNATRQLLGPDALLYTNECSEMAKWDYIPHNLDLISMDIYGGYLPGTNASEEVKLARDFYSKFVFPKLGAHQQAMLVPGTFACSNTSFYPLDQQDEQVAAKLQGYFEWAKSEPQIAGFNPWHYKNRSSPQHDPPCDMELGIEALPSALEVVKSIGKYIVGR